MRVRAFLFRFCICISPVFLSSCQRLARIEERSAYRDMNARLSALETLVKDAADGRDEAGASAPQFFINPMHYGVTGDGTTDDSAAIQKCVDLALEQRVPICFPRGTFRISQTIRCYRWTQAQGRYSAHLKGVGVGGTVFEFYPREKNQVMLLHAEHFTLEEMTLRCAGVEKGYRGIAICTPDNTQSAHSMFRRLEISGPFRYGIWRRFSLYDTFRHIQSRGPCVHMWFAMSNDKDDLLAMPASSWNAGNKGWFHNLSTFDHVACNGGEVGIGGGLMGSHYTQVACERMMPEPDSAFTLLPANEVPTGLWLIGKGPGSDRNRAANVIGTYYTEATLRALKVQHQEAALVINGMFTQGGWDEKWERGQGLLELDDANVIISSWTCKGTLPRHQLKAMNGSSAVIHAFSGRRAFKADATSTIEDYSEGK